LVKAVKKRKLDCQGPPKTHFIFIFNRYFTMYIFQRPKVTIIVENFVAPDG
jgi:hypothetical protein